MYRVCKHWLKNKLLLECALQIALQISSAADRERRRGVFKRKILQVKNMMSNSLVEKHPLKERRKVNFSLFSKISRVSSII